MGNFHKVSGLSFHFLTACLLLCLTANSYATDTQNQQKTIKGKVTDAEDGSPMPGVNILVKNTETGTSTNAEGDYELTVPSMQDTLVFSFIGYETQEVPVSEQTTINVELQSKSFTSDELVVVGYGTQKEEEVTSSVAKVKAEDFNEGGVQSPVDLVQGKVSGLTLTRTEGSNPNAGTSIQLRGVTSLHGNIEPLVVIDGIPGGNMDLLEPSDIESIDVLKDGSAAAIYGTRGNNGVILITTKKGKGGEPSFEYNTYFRHEQIAKKPDYLTPSEYRSLIDDGLIGESNDKGHSVNLYDELINKNNLSQYHNFSASGGSESTNYRASFYYDDKYGIAKENSRRQYGGRVNINHLGLNDKLELQSNIVANFNKANLLGGDGGDFEQAIQHNPTEPLFDDDGDFVNPSGYNAYNPLSRYANRINKRNQLTFSGDVKATLNITDNLGVSVFGAYQRNSWNGRQYRSMEDYEQRETSEYQGMGYAYKENHLNWDNTLEATVDYSADFASDHSLDFVGGYSYQYFTNEEFWVDNSGFTTDGFKDWNLGAGSAITDTNLPRPGMDSFKEDNTLIAFFGRASYSYKSKYHGQLTFRREGSSKFGANNKWGNFPAISVGWTLSEEEFMRDIDQIGFLKIRAGYGVTGNQGIDNYQSIVTLSTGGVYPQKGTYYETYGPAKNQNPDLRWEKKQEWNVGLEFSLFEDIISGDLDFYNRETVDLLHNYTAQQPPFVQSNIFTNVGSIRNKGIELALSASIIQNQDYSWNMNLNASTQSNKLTSLSDETYTLSWLEYGGLPAPGNLGNAIRLEEGGSVGNFYGKRFAGFTEDGEWLFYDRNGEKVSADEVSDKDYTVIGNGVPKHYLSWTNKFQYQNFDLTILFRGKFGFDILNTKDLYFGNKKWLPDNVLKSAITEHEELDADPQYSDYYLEKGDFVKLDNVTLGYTFGFASDYVKRLRVYATGRNLFTITGYSGLDPELADTGFETGIDNRGFYPSTRSYTVGLNIQF